MIDFIKVKNKNKTHDKTPQDYSYWIKNDF